MRDEGVVSGMRRHRADDGHTLVELLAAMAIGSIVLTALLTVFTRGLDHSMQVYDRTESTGRARVAIERMTTLLDSQVCVVARTTLPDGSSIDQSVPPVLPGSTGSAVTFFADLDGASARPDRYALVYDAAAKTLTELRYRGTGDLPSRTFPAQPTSRRVLADNIVPARGATGRVPIFRYYAFEPDGSVDVSKPLAAEPLSAADAPRSVRVRVTFQANAARTRADDGRRTVLDGEGTVATANPTDRTTCS